MKSPLQSSKYPQYCKYQIISEQEGKTVIVPCPVNKDKCGELHSLNWFKGDNRIAAMLLDDSNVTSVAEEFEDRVSVEQNPFRLIIRNLQISDEDIYLCDTTYFIPIETCDNFNGHRVELNVLVPPSEVVILDEKGDRIENGSIVGPMQERQTLKATCIVKNTRPQPQVGWWRGNKRLTTHSPSYDEKDGLFTATLELSLQLSRDDLGHSIECRAESAAIQSTIKNHFSVDLQVRPTTVTINGVEHHTVQGSKVVLTCDVHGARPPVNLTWFNASQPMDPEENDLMEIRTRAFEKEDGTYHTQSDLIFNASRFENDVKFVCQAENIVLQINREAPMQSLLTLEVLYPPVVKVSPPEITVNTSDTVLLNCEYVANPASLDHVVWYRNGEIVNVNDTERYEGGNSENVALVIRSTEKQDIGNYTCQLSNAIGKGVSEQQIDLDVQYVPIVEVLMIPEGPVKESDESNVTLFCNILDANPSVLTKVRWYANSTLLKELPDCEETREDLCHIDPSKLLLESIGRGFFYNYSCEGYNAAGWGPRSEDKELLVHYEPGPATLTHFPLIAVKKKSVTFSCSVDDPGYPESNRFVQETSIIKNHTQNPLTNKYQTYQNLQTHYTSTISKSSLTNNKAQSSSTSLLSSSSSTSPSATSLPLTSKLPLALPQIHFYTIQALTASEIEEAYEALIGEHFQKQQLKQVQIHDHYQHQQQYHHHHHHQQQQQHAHYTPQHKNNRNPNYSRHQHHRHKQNSHTDDDDDDDDADVENDNNQGDNVEQQLVHEDDDGVVNVYDDDGGLEYEQQHNIAAVVQEHKENPHVKPKHVLKETHALIDLTNNSLCTLLTLTTFSPQSQILTLLTHTPTTTTIAHGIGNNNNAATKTHTNTKSITMSSSQSSTTSSSQQQQQSSATLSFYRKMGKFSFNARTTMPSPRFRWLRGGRGPLQDIVTKDWTVEPVGLDSRTNYSCYAFNEGGKGVMATVNLEVHAPPFFIKNLPPYTGMLHTSRNANLTCRIECVPRCEISWLKDGVPIEKNDTRYFVKDKYMDASPATGDFESMLSVLHFNMSNWPNNKFDIEGDNANYTCVSTGNTVGPGIKSATYFSIEYAPDNTTVSEEVVYVAENTIPGRVICKSRANPEPTYEWRFNNKTVIRGNALIINTRMKRNDTGRYTCVAYNKHGRSTAETFIDVQFTPRCEIERQEIEDKDTLICTAYGNPEEADFSWSIKGDNETVEWLGNGDHKAFKDKSYYELKEDYAIARTYRCVANNTAGAGTFCEIEVAEQLAWWQRWDTTTLIILVASILVLLLAVIIICCIIICICRRRRRQDKYTLANDDQSDICDHYELCGNCVRSTGCIASS
ncbi:Kin of IRRE-like protein 2 [Lucilia cuprina]|nr:Kin of IRRE-like protein 2 [Lucilia cuprina]